MFMGIVYIYGLELVDIFEIYLQLFMMRKYGFQIVIFENFQIVCIVIVDNFISGCVVIYCMYFDKYICCLIYSYKNKCKLNLYYIM